MPPLVVLIGAPGAGKSTVGALLADRLGVAFRDTDVDVQRTSGRSVSDIFVTDGEAAFRAWERSAVADALAEHAGVLSLGGGAVADPKTRDDLRGLRVVLLEVGFADASRRIGLNRDRPLLLGNPRAQLRELLDARRPIYAEVSTDVVSTVGRTPDEVVDDLLTVLAPSDSR
jgi:shikimate kinase